MNAAFLFSFESGSIPSILFYCPRTTTPIDFPNPVSGNTKMGKVGWSGENIYIPYDIKIKTRGWETKLYLISFLKNKISFTF